jgi:NADPH2:quinone reductase
VKVNYLLLKNISISGLQWSDYRDRMPEKMRSVQAVLFELWGQGAIRPRIMQHFDFEELPKALEMVALGKVQGKVVVSMSGNGT